MAARYRTSFSFGLGGLYALLYLYAIGDIDLGKAGWEWYWVPFSLERLVAMRSLFHFEAIAVIESGYAVFLLSPANMLLAASLGMLLGVNLHGVLDLRDRRTCGLSGNVGWAVGAVPALLAGGACCAPSLVLLLSLPGLGALAGFFAWLIPTSLLLLAVSRWWQRRLGANKLLGWL